MIEIIKYYWGMFWFKEEHPTHMSYGGSYRINRTFRYERLALVVIGILVLILLIK